MHTKHIEFTTVPYTAEAASGMMVQTTIYVSALLFLNTSRKQTKNLTVCHHAESLLLHQPISWTSTSTSYLVRVRRSPVRFYPPCSLYSLIIRARLAWIHSSRGRLPSYFRPTQEVNMMEWSLQWWNKDSTLAFHNKPVSQKTPHSLGERSILARKRSKVRKAEPFECFH